MTRTERRQLFAIVLGGVFFRALFLFWVRPLEFWADEGQYAYQALAWNRFGFYVGSPDWVWPPGYPAYLAAFFRLFGADGVLAAKVGQVLLSACIGGSVILMARRLFSHSAARVAGCLWAIYLPLISYTHFLWPETLFLAALLPALCLFLGAIERDESRPLERVIGCGLLLGVACFFKEAPLPLLLFLPIVLVFARRGEPLALRLGLAAALVLSAVTVILPWSLRTEAVYGHMAPTGATLGENMFQGLNTEYINYDYAGAPAIKTVGTTGLVYRWFVQPPADAQKWERSTLPNTLERNAENVASGKRFARQYPLFVLRSRIKKVADWFTPLNFFQRHHRLDVYTGSVTHPWVRRPLALLSLALTALALAGGIGGLLLRLPQGAQRWTLVAVITTFLASAAVVSMSRYRVPVEPFLLVLTAGLLTARAGPRPTINSRRLAYALWACLLLLWAINAREILAMWRRTW